MRKYIINTFITCILLAQIWQVFVNVIVVKAFIIMVFRYFSSS